MANNYTVRYRYENGIEDAMVIENALSPSDAVLSVVMYTTGIGISNIHVMETTEKDGRYTRQPAFLKGINNGSN